MMKPLDYDAIVVGSGFGAAPPALRLRRAGLRTLVIEKGPRIDPLKDFKQTQDPSYLLHYLKSMKNRDLTLNYVEALGGGSGFYEKVMLRAPAIVFDQQTGNGRKLWPDGLNRQTLDPYYRIGEVMLRVHQISEVHVPKNGLIFSWLMKNLNYSVDRARYADSFCCGCGYCVFGCTYAGKESLLVNYIPKAEDHGTEILTDMEVTRIKPCGQYYTDGSSESNSPQYKGYFVEAYSRITRAIRIFRTSLLILAGGTLGTARLLMRSREFLPLISHEVGKNIAINGSIRVAALLPEWCPDGDMFTGQSHPGMVSYQFFNSHGIMVSACKALPLQIFGTARILDPVTHQFWGTDHMHLMEKLRRRMIFLDIHGITRPNTTLSLNKKGNLKMKVEVNHDLIDYNRKAQKIARDILIRNGCKMLNIQYLNGKGVVYKDLHFHSAHQVGSCRMADNAQNGVVNADGEVFNYPGLYITDGSVIPSSTGVNVSLTILANSERITEKIISRYRHRKLTASL